MHLGDCFGKTQFLSKSYDLHLAPVCEPGCPTCVPDLADGHLAEWEQIPTAVFPEEWRVETGAADKCPWFWNEMNSHAYNLFWCTHIDSIDYLHAPYCVWIITEVLVFMSLRAIINHFNPKIESYAAVNHISQLSEEQVNTLFLLLHFDQELLLNQNEQRLKPVWAEPQWNLTVAISKVSVINECFSSMETLSTLR